MKYNIEIFKKNYINFLKALLFLDDLEKSNEIKNLIEYYENFDFDKNYIENFEKNLSKIINHIKDKNTLQCHKNRRKENELSELYFFFLDWTEIPNDTCTVSLT